MNALNSQARRSRLQSILACGITLSLCLVALAQAPPIRFAVISDPHYMDPQLGVTGEAFQAYVDDSQKMERESKAILESALQGVIDSGAQFVLISGDLTMEGQLINHVRFAQYLNKLEQRGIQVLVVPGNHDINNLDSAAYMGSRVRPAPTVNSATFQALYQRFGYGEALSLDPYSLSYLAEPVNGLQVLALDACRYDENKGLGYTVVDGMLKPETLAWATQHIQAARASGKQIIAFMHHGVNAHFTFEPILYPMFLTEEWRSDSTQLADAGLRVILTGHFHANDTAYLLDSHNQPIPTLCDVETGSLVTYPSPYRIITVEGSSLHIETQHVTEIAADTGGLPFPEYSLAFLEPRLTAFFVWALQEVVGMSEADAVMFAPLLTQGNIAHYVGDESPDAEVLEPIYDIILSDPDPLHRFVAYGALSFWTDVPPQDNSLTLPME